MIPFLLIIKTFQFYYLLPAQDKILHGEYNKIQLFLKYPQAETSSVWSVEQRLRKKLESIGMTDVIRTKKGIGYLVEL